MYPRRLAPYPSPAMHMSQKRQQQVSAYPSPGPNPSMQPGFPPSAPQVIAIFISYCQSVIQLFESKWYTILL